MTEIQFAIETAGKGHSRTEPNRKREGPGGDFNSESCSDKREREKEKNTEQISSWLSHIFRGPVFMTDMLFKSLI